MARGIESVVTAWLNDRKAAKGNVQTDGRVLMSYMTPIGVQLDNGDIYVLKAGEYSVTTSKHCNYAASECPQGVLTRCTKDELKALL